MLRYYVFIMDDLEVLVKIRSYKIFTYTILLLSSVILLFGCSGQTQHEEFITEKEEFYNLYFFGNNSKTSKDLEEEFFKRWNTEDYPNVNKTSNYNISDKENAPSPLAIDVLELNKDNTPVFILFDNKGEVLRTSELDEILNYLSDKENNS